MKFFLLTLTTLLFFPFYANAKVSITEIAWMGTTNSQYSEWIELYNDGNQSIDLNGWKLYEAGGDTTIFSFSKSIPAGGLLLLERTTTSAPDAVSGINDESGTFGGSGLSNSGEFLVLKDSDGNIEETLDFSTGWPAGDKDTKDTMQWNGSIWVTLPPTPKILNQGIVVPTPDDNNNNTDNTGNDGDVQNDDSGGTTDTDNPPPKKKTGGGAFATAPKNSPHIEFVVPKVIYTDVPNDYKATVVLDYMNPDRGIFIWNMGDGTVVRQTTLTPLNHTYEYSGKYTLSFAYYRSDYDNRPYMSESIVYDVVDPTIEVTTFDNGKALKIKNPTDKKLDLSNWKISSNGVENIFPEMTIVAPKAIINIPINSFGMSNISAGNIVAPNGQIVTSFGLDSNTSSVKIVKSSYTNFAPLIKASAIESSEQNSSVVFMENKSENNTQKQNHTKYIIFGVVSLITIGLVILLERFMVQQE